ncbi:hypothetical protein CRENBAI_009528 [Crenichthys baileyi]|uniref:Uncharacterized protein n=1 Tax=Crenichthys baileyi TaxID=28760 RepID=A0AAV9RS14_9TELE
MFQQRLQCITETKVQLHQTESEKGNRHVVAVPSVFQHYTVFRPFHPSKLTGWAGRSSQEAHWNYGGAADIHSSGDDPVRRTLNVVKLPWTPNRETDQTHDVSTSLRVEIAFLGSHADCPAWKTIISESNTSTNGHPR